MRDPQGLNLVKKHGLSTAELAEVEGLAAICNQYENLAVPISGKENDLLLCEGPPGLIGVLSLEHFPPTEVSLMVHPQHRRRGMGRALLDAARHDCRKRGISSWLLVSDEASASGKGFAAAVGAQYRFSEHQMELHRENVPPPPRGPGPLQLHPALAADVGALARLTAISFGESETQIRERFEREMRQPDFRFFLGVVNGEAIASLRLASFGPSVYITAFGVLPQHRGQGYGRHMLLSTVHLLLAENWERILLEVGTRNRGALSLYQFSGFKVTRTYLYYHMDL